MKVLPPKLSSTRGTPEARHVHSLMRRSLLTGLVRPSFLLRKASNNQAAGEQDERTRERADTRQASGTPTWGRDDREPCSLNPRPVSTALITTWETPSCSRCSPRHQYVSPNGTPIHMPSLRGSPTISRAACMSKGRTDSSRSCNGASG